MLDTNRMSYQVLARKWRPKSFDSLVGQEHVVRALSHALDAGRLHHAYLLTGTRGVGKTTIARILAKALNCEKGLGSSPCGSCSACREIESGRYVDLLEIDAATNTRVEEMRQLLENAVYAPTRGRFKVYVIDEVHMLSTSAFNAMLKTLEEPPAHVKFILATTDPQKIPVTVLSRCLQFSLKQMPKAAIEEHLRHVLGEEAVEYESEALEHIAHAASGSMRDALSLLDQAISHGGGRIAAAGVQQMLGVVDSDGALGLLANSLFGEIDELLLGIRAMGDEGLSFDAALREMASGLIQVQVRQLNAEGSADVGGNRHRIAQIAERLSPDMVQLAYQIVIHGRDELRFAPDAEAGFMMVMLRLNAFSPSDSPARKMPTGGRPGASTGRPPIAGKQAVAPVLPRVPVDPPLAAERVTAWADLVSRLALSGMARELAQHCELESQTDGALRLRLSPAHKHLLVPVSEGKLKKALMETLAEPVRLEIRLADTVGETPAARGQREKAEKQDQAIAAIESDGFVRQVVDMFDAQIVDSSIKPLNREQK